MCLEGLQHPISRLAVKFNKLKGRWGDGGGRGGGGGSKGGGSSGVSPGSQMACGLYRRDAEKEAAGRHLQLYLLLRLLLLPSPFSGNQLPSPIY